VTAASAFVGRSAAFLVSDAGSFLADGTLVSIGSKVIASDRLRIAAVMSGREFIVENASGIYSPAHDVGALLERCGSQREFRDHLPPLMRTLYEVTRKVSSGYFQFAIGLWNAAQRRPEAYVIGTPGHTFPDLGPFMPAGIGESVMPEVDRSLWPRGDELTRDEALAIIKAQRRHRQADGSIHVAGFAELTTVNEHGVATEELIRWRDRIGRKVGARRRLLFLK
jgi:hypothetical protein